MTQMSTPSDDTIQARKHRKERLHKILAHAGVASRRKCEDLIAAGRVTVNGELASTPGQRVDPEHDRIEVDGESISLPQTHTYVMLNKPAGYLSTVRDPHGRPTVLDLLETDKRLYPVGRLDMDSEGLMLLTDDGGLTQRLTHPSYEHEKEYHVRVKGQPTQRNLELLREGIELEDGFTWPAEVSALRQEQGDTWLRFVIHEGRKRQLRRMCEAVGHPVRRLIRVRMGPLSLGNLAPGQYRILTKGEQAQLRQAVGLPLSTSDDKHAENGQASSLAPRRSSKIPVSLRYPGAIAIDGPAAAGKSTVGELLAEKLGYLYFDTGVMYRAVTWAAMQRGIAIEDEEAVSKLAQEAEIDVRPPTVDDGRQYTVQVDGQDVTWDLRRAEVDRQVSPVSAYPQVRQALTTQQRRIGQRGRVVMVGRDIGTVVLPKAPLKIYLDATVEERARRRCRENEQRGQPCVYEDILRDMRRRDKIDSSRTAAPLRAAKDAVVIDTTNLSITQVMQRIERHIQEREP
jgi:cytidylate kinase